MAGSIRTFVTDGLTRPILEDTECVQKQKPNSEKVEGTEQERKNYGSGPN